MSEVSLMFAVIAALYLWECACWLPLTSTACVTWFGKYWHIARPGQFFGNQHGGFVLAWPLPLLGSIVIGNRFPLSLSPQGISIPVTTAGRKSSGPGFVAFAEMKAVEARGRKLTINGNTFLKLASPTLTDFVAQELRELRAVAADKRAPVIEKMLQATFDLRAIRARRTAFRSHDRAIRWTTNSLLLFIFAFAPMMICHFGLRATWLSLVIGMLALTTMTAISFYLAHKEFFPAADDDRFTLSFTVWLAPATSMRAHDLLSRRLFEGFHPLAVARVFCSDADFREFAGKTLRELRHTIVPAVPGAQTRQETDAASRQMLMRVMETFLRKNKINPEDLSRPPKPTDDSCQAFCPRCLTQFTAATGECADCGGVPLVAFKGVAAGKSAMAR